MNLPPATTAVLERLAAGGTMKQIAVEFGVSPYALHRRLEVARQRHGCTTTVQLVAAWVLDGTKGSEHVSDEKCGCEAWADGEGHTREVKRCPLHEAGPEAVRLLRAALSLDANESHAAIVDARAFLADLLDKHSPGGVTQE